MYSLIFPTSVSYRILFRVIRKQSFVSYMFIGRLRCLVMTGRREMSPCHNKEKEGRFFFLTDCDDFGAAHVVHVILTVICFVFRLDHQARRRFDRHSVRADIGQPTQRSQ